MCSTQPTTCLMDSLWHQWFVYPEWKCCSVRKGVCYSFLGAAGDLVRGESSCQYVFFFLGMNAVYVRTISVVRRDTWQFSGISKNECRTNIFMHCVCVWLMFSLILESVKRLTRQQWIPLRQCCIFYENVSVMSFVPGLIWKVSSWLHCGCLPDTWWTVMCSQAMGTFSISRSWLILFKGHKAFRMESVQSLHLMQYCEAADIKIKADEDDVRQKLFSTM